jgi:hypothetical protein
MKKLTRPIVVILILCVITAFSTVTASAAYYYDQSLTIYDHVYTEYSKKLSPGDGTNLNVTLYNTGTVDIQYTLYFSDPNRPEISGNLVTTVTPNNRYVTTWYVPEGVAYQLNLNLTTSIYGPDTTTFRFIVNQW